MASSLSPARSRLPARSRRTVIALLAAGGVVLTSLPASADPGPATSQEAAALVAARAHDLEVLTEEFNETRERLKASQEAAEIAGAELAAAEEALAEARERIRTVARSAYTGDRLGTLQAMVTSGSPTELLSRVALLQSVADHNNGVLGVAEEADDAADRAKGEAQQAAAQAQQQVDQVSVQRDRLDAQIAVYQAQYERLGRLTLPPEPDGTTSGSGAAGRRCHQLPPPPPPAPPPT